MSCPLLGRGIFATRKPLRHRLNALAIARTDQSSHVEWTHLSPRLVRQPIQKWLEKASKLFFPIRRPATHGRALLKADYPGVTKKLNPTPLKIAKVVLVWIVNKPARMTKSREDVALLPIHGAAGLPGVTIDSYGLKMGDAANKGGFDAIFYKWRELLKERDHGTLGRVTASKVSKKKLADLLVKGDPADAGLVHSAVEEFGQELSRAIMSLLRRKEWKGTECVVIGGGFQASQIGRLAVGRCELLLREENMRPARSSSAPNRGRP